MICAILTLLAVILAVWLLFTWVAMHIMTVAGVSEYPDIIEDVPPELLSCPRCGHRCETCFKGVPEETATMWHYNECGWIGPRAK